MRPHPRARMEPQWPVRLITLCRAVGTTTAFAGSGDRNDLWVLLRDCLLAAISAEACRFRGVTREDVQDLASNKALELLRRAEQGEWDPTGRSSGEVVLYIRSTARRALMRL